MKITFVIPSQEFLASAGARIRYLRMLPLAQTAGHAVNLVPMSDFAALDAVGDAVIFSKCFDARAIVAAARCRAQGASVGLDLFDDYFTQTTDSRMTLYRTWLDEMLSHAHYAICSTKRMAEIVEQRRPGLPVHVFNDPAADLREEALPDLLEAKREKALAERHISLCWFGIGDNPFFPVGLEDLVAFGPRLAVLRDKGWRIDLTVSTNSRALDADRLAGLSRLPFPVHVELWSEERETELLLESMCCFLPVNSQPFSIAKSLNRAVSALTAGAQVIWAGYPLYRDFKELVYADPESFADDIQTGKLRHSAARLNTYRALMQEFASLETEVQRMLTFLEANASGLAAQDRERPKPLQILVHGVQTNGNAHKEACKHGLLSVGTPFSPPSLTYDVLFAGPVAGDDLHMLVAETALKRLPDHVAAAARPFGKINKTNYFAWDWPEGRPMLLDDWGARDLPDMLAMYAGIFRRIEEKMEATFGPVTMMIAEASKLPFDPAAEGPGHDR